MKEKKELIIILGSLLVVVLSVTLAYFTTEIFGSGKDISLDSANLKITFSSGSGNISGVNIEPGWSSGISTFTVKNESNDTYKYNIVIKDLVNTFVTTGFLQYKITSTDGGYNMSAFKDIPKSTTQKDTILAYSVEIAKGDTHTYSVEFKYENSSEVDQSDDMGKILSGILYIEKGTEDPHGIYAQGTLGWQIMDDNLTRETRTDFSTTFTTTNTGVIFQSTESIDDDTYDVYYFAGDISNNWVKFGTYQTDDPDGKWSAGDDIYWRIIRTNHDGSIRLLYSGTSPDTTEGYIGKSAFNYGNNPMYVGYMYGTSGTLASNRTNENDSTIKTYIDNWYNTYFSSYTKYLSTQAVYCNDRKAPDYDVSNEFYYYVYTRINAGNPTYDCEDSKDAFSGSNSEAKLTYPIGLMTADELAYAGGYMDTSLTSPYAWYYTNSTGGSITGDAWWWLLSPGGWGGLGLDGGAISWLVYDSSGPGSLGSYYVSYSTGVRPVISLKTCALWTSGNGAPETPYEISTTSGC